MEGVGSAALIDWFSRMPDPRVNRRKLHPLVSIIMIAICGVICGADSWCEIESFGKAKLKWLRQFLPLPHGIPSHDTFGRVFARLQTERFRHCFLAWTEAVSRATQGEVVAIDGKTLRHSFDRFLGQGAIRLVSAWAWKNHVVLGQVRVAEEGNEATALPDLLRLLELSGCIVTIDAAGCHKEIAQQIVAQGGDYVLALKGNQARWFEHVQSLFDYAQEVEFREIPHDYCKTVEKGHGRIEVRHCWTTSAPEYLEYLAQWGPWPGLRSINKVVYERRVGEQVSRETHYYLSSLSVSAKHMLATVRTHWRIENSLHWILDIAFREDECRVRRDHAPENFSILRQIALHLLKQDHTVKLGVKGKRLTAGWDEDYLLRLLFQH